jgi:predicted nucleic acid-binding protein
MTPYADANFFANLLLELPHSHEAVALAGEAESCGAPPWPVFPILRMEVMNAIQRLVFESRTGNQPLRVTPEAALVAAGVFDDQLGAGIVTRRVKLNEAALERQFDTLCLRHTAKLGFRTYDLLHVSGALVLGCDTFWSFDTRARKLAELEGLRTN